MAKDTKERILAAALEQFPQNGYAEREEINIASQRVLQKSGFMPTGEIGEEGPK